jgi:uncharacterized membrane protein YgcG
VVWKLEAAAAEVACVEVEVDADDSKGAAGCVKSLPAAAKESHRAVIVKCPHCIQAATEALAEAVKHRTSVEASASAATAVATKSGDDVTIMTQTTTNAANIAAAHAGVIAAQDERCRVLEVPLTLKVRCVSVTNKRSIAVAQAMIDPLDDVNGLANRYGGGKERQQLRGAENELSLRYDGDLDAPMEAGERGGAAEENGGAGSGSGEGIQGGGGGRKIKSWGQQQVTRGATQGVGGAMAACIAASSTAAPKAETEPEAGAGGAALGMRPATCVHRGEVAGPRPLDSEAWRVALEIPDIKAREAAHRMAVMHRRDASRPATPCAHCTGGCTGRGGATLSRRAPARGRGSGGSGGGGGGSGSAAPLCEALSLPEDSLPIWGPTADDVNPAVIGPKRCAALA